MDVLVLSKEWEAPNLEDELDYCSCFVIASIAHFTQMKRETGGEGDSIDAHIQRVREMGQVQEAEK